MGRCRIKVEAISRVRRPQDKKDIERYWAENAARSLGMAWDIGPNREHPDFIVDADNAQFGLEVTECHIGSTRKKGSALRAGEQFRQEWLRDLRERYEAEGGPLLHLRYYHGRADPNRSREILQILGAAKLDQQSEFAEFRHEFDDGWLLAFRTPHAHWQASDDRSGAFSNDGSILQRAINAKLVRLAEYRRACADVRLLVVSQTMYNSGRLAIPDGFRPKLGGFNAVYFYSYPRSVTTYSGY